MSNRLGVDLRLVPFLQNSEIVSAFRPWLAARPSITFQMRPIMPDALSVSKQPVLGLSPKPHFYLLNFQKRKRRPGNVVAAVHGSAPEHASSNTDKYQKPP